MELQKKYIDALEEIKNPRITNKASLQTWKAKAINIISRIYGENSNQQKQIDEIKFQNYMAITTFNNGHASTAGGGNNASVCEKQATELIESFVSDINKFGLPSKDKLPEKTDGINITVNQSQNQTQSQKQTVNIDIIIKALQEELTGKQFSEIQQIIDEEEKPETKQNRIVEKLKSFGKDIASNVIANILTNPALYS